MIGGRVDRVVTRASVGRRVMWRARLACLLRTSKDELAICDEEE